MRVVAFTGLPGSGKTDAVDEARRRGLPIVVMGDFVRAEARAKNLEPVDANLGKLAQELRRQHGPDVLAHRTADRVQKEHRGAKLIVIDGVRSLEEIHAFRTRFGNSFHVVAIEARDDQRHERLRGRGRSDDSTSVEQLKLRDEREKAWGVLEAMQKADMRLSNRGSLDEFRRDVSQLFDRLMSSAEAGSETGRAPGSSGKRP